jgi:E3 ubiquitin-protein ligase RAD18
MKEASINAHLDKCLAGEVPSSPPPSTTNQPSQSPHPPHVVSGTIAYTQTKPSTTSRLPTLNYSLFNETALRKRLKDLGIPNTGSKELMKKRHMEWLNLWNANSDSLHPVSKLQLLKDLNTWERTLGRQVETGQQAKGVMVKDFDREGYVEKQKTNFDDLIRRARESRVAKATGESASSSKLERPILTTEAEAGSRAAEPILIQDSADSSQHAPRPSTISEQIPEAGSRYLASRGGMTPSSSQLSTFNPSYSATSDHISPANPEPQNWIPNQCQVLSSVTK